MTRGGVRARHRSGARDQDLTQLKCHTQVPEKSPGCGEVPSSPGESPWSWLWRSPSSPGEVPWLWRSPLAVEKFPKSWSALAVKESRRSPLAVEKSPQVLEKSPGCEEVPQVLEKSPGCGEVPPSPGEVPWLWRSLHSQGTSPGLGGTSPQPGDFSRTWGDFSTARGLLQDLRDFFTARGLLQDLGGLLHSQGTSPGLLHSQGTPGLRELLHSQGTSPGLEGLLHSQGTSPGPAERSPPEYGRSSLVPAVEKSLEPWGKPSSPGEAPWPWL